MNRKLTELAETYEYLDVNLLFVRNRNEKRVIEAMRQVLPEDYPDYVPNAIDVQDIYALSLNGLMPRYIQQGSIVLREPVQMDEVKASVRRAVETVRHRPNYSSGH
ncbi:late competence development ComFB family protein [Desulfocurvus sp. DL9XJH121]